MTIETKKSLNIRGLVKHESYTHLNTNNKSNSRRKSGVIYADYRIRCTNINNRIKQYVNVLFRKFDDEKDDKINLKEFEKWLDNHPKMMDSYIKTFSLQFWKMARHPITNKSILSFKLKDPEFFSECWVTEANKSKKLMWVEIHWKLLLIFKNKDEDIPSIAKYMDLLYLEETKPLTFELSHPSKIYKKIQLTFLDEKKYKDIKNRLSYLQGTQCKQMYDFIEKVGTGRFSVVFKGTSKVLAKSNDRDQKSKHYAIKVIEKTVLTEEELIMIQNETMIMKMLHHSSIIRYYETYDSKDNIYIVTEYVKDGDLFDHILNNGFIEEYEASLVIRQLIQAINYLHNTGIIHRDLKPENIMVEKDDKEHLRTVKIIDFGFSCLVENLKKNSICCGTPNYVAPEVFGSAYDQRSDVFSIGVILYLILRGNLPFDA